MKVIISCNNIAMFQIEHTAGANFDKLRPDSMDNDTPYLHVMNSINIPM